jgi:hypothetical protein
MDLYGCILECHAYAKPTDKIVPSFIREIITSVRMARKSASSAFRNIILSFYISLRLWLRTYQMV